MYDIASVTRRSVGCACGADAAVGAVVGAVVGVDVPQELNIIESIAKNKKNRPFIKIFLPKNSIKKRSIPMLPNEPIVVLVNLPECRVSM
jgi:hypothetical protein